MIIHASIAGRYIGLAFSALVLAGCAKLVKEQVTMPPRDLSIPVRSLNIKPFSSSRYGGQLADEVKNQLANEGYILVSSHDAEATLGGTLTVGRLDCRQYTTSFQVEKKEKGRKRKTTEHLYHIKKSLPTSVTYSVEKGGSVLGGNTYSTSYEREWTGSSAAEARAAAETDEAIIQSQFGVLARQIVEGISPHKELWSFKLQGASLMGGNQYLQAGIDYYIKGLYPQAEDYWSRVISENKDPKDTAAAYYNMGVLKMREAQYEDAFKMFRDADRLDPANSVYMDALMQVERAGHGQQELTRQGMRPVDQGR